MKKIYSCQYCDYKTNKNFNFKRHQNTLHKQNSEIDDSNENLKEHQNISDKQNSEINDSNENLKEHLNTSDEQNSEIDNSNKNLKEHLNTSDEQNSEINDSNENLKEHLNTSDEKKRIELFCEKCNKKYLTKKHLDNHIKKCNGLDSLTCPRCMKHFATHGSKSRHIKDNNCKPRSIIHATNNNFDINNYGSERTDYINIDNIINEVKINETSIIPRYIELKHFNDDFPENKNIKYEKNNDCLVKIDGKWKIRNLNHMSEMLILDISTELKEYVSIKYNTKHYNNIKTEIKDIIKSSKV
jgi:hypothetical protein